MDHAILEQLGVTPHSLSDIERQTLDSLGYLNLGRLLGESELRAVQQHLAALLDREGGRAGSELLESKHIRHPTEPGVDRLADLVNKGAIFDICYTHPRLLAAVAHVLGPHFKLSALNYRAAKPGFGAQKLHVDWREPVSPGDFQVCNSIWLLDDFQLANGATRLVPSSHVSGTLPEEVLADPSLVHPDEIYLEAPAGTVVVFNSHLWHGGTVNQTTRPRRAIHSYFCRSHQPQQVDQRKYLTRESQARLTPQVIELLGVGNHSPDR